MQAQIIVPPSQSQLDVPFSYAITRSATDKENWSQHEMLFTAFVHTLQNRGHRPGMKDGSGIVAAELRHRARLEDKNVLRVTAVVLDVDGKIRENGTEIVRSIDPDEFLSKLPFRGVAHTSYNHSPALAKFRVILPLREPVTKDEFLRIWWWAYETCGRTCDPSCKNPSRMFYLPRYGDGSDPASHWIRELHGPFLSAASVPADFRIPSGAGLAPTRHKTGLHLADHSQRYRTADPHRVLDELLALDLYVWALEFPTQVSREAWRGLATNLAALVIEDDDMYEPCSQAFHNLSCVDPGRYSYATCERTFKDALKSARDVGPMTWTALQAAGAPEEACSGMRERSPIAVARGHAFRRAHDDAKDAVRQRANTATVLPDNAPFIQEIAVVAKDVAVAVPVVKEPAPVEARKEEPPPAKAAPPDPAPTASTGPWGDPSKFVFDASSGNWLQWDVNGILVAKMSDTSFTRALFSAGHDKKSAEQFKQLCPHVSNSKHFYDRSDRIVTEAGIDYLNLYTPSTLQPIPGNWEPIRQLIVNLCGGDLVGTEFVLDWLAKPLQSIQNGKPWRTLTALVFYGQPGSGKGTLATMLRTMYGLQNSTELNQEVLDGRFNDMLVGKLFVLCNEVISSSNREDSTFNKIKPWVTDEYVNIEKKFSDRQEVVPTFNLIFMSNDKRPVPVASDDRRYIIFASKKLPKEISDTVWDDIHGDQKMLSAFYAALLTRPAKIAKGQLYETEARRELMRRTMPSWDRFILSIKEDGWMSVSRDWVSAGNPNAPARLAVERPNFVSSTTLMGVYTEYCKNRGIKPGAYQNLLGAIRDILPNVEATRLRVGQVPVRGWENMPMEPEGEVKTEEQAPAAPEGPLDLRA